MYVKELVGTNTTKIGCYHYFSSTEEYIGWFKINNKIEIYLTYSALIPMASFVVNHKLHDQFLVVLQLFIGIFGMLTSSPLQHSMDAVMPFHLKIQILFTGQARWTCPQIYGQMYWLHKKIWVHILGWSLYLELCQSWFESKKISKFLLYIFTVICLYMLLIHELSYLIPDGK